MAMAPPIVVTEDTPPDMLAGSMDLSVVLPSGHSLKMSVDRSTPMMDLLVQVTTGNKLSPAGHTLQPLNEQGSLPYKPSTPIGALDAWTIHVVPKHNIQGSGNKNSYKSLNQPFEQTFRLQVHLPRNQLFVARVSPRTKLSEILRQVCVEKNLDPLKYSLRHPNNLDLVLRLPCSLADYKLQEVTLVCNQSHPVQVSVSTVDIMSLQRDSTNPAYRNTLCEGSVSSGSLEGRSLSPAPSDESSASPPPLPPSRPTRKRRPAPKPPTVNQKQAVTIEEKKQNGVQSSTVINHSRNSSDSSGYHEASVLSDSPQNNNVPESLVQHKTTRVSETVPLSKSMTDVTVIEPTLKQAISSNSISSLSSNPTRKKKAAPPPPPNANIQVSIVLGDLQKTSSMSSTASSTTTLDGNETNTGVKSATLPPSSRLNSVTKGMSPPPSPSPPLSTKVDVEPLLSRKDPPAPRPRSRLMEEDGELHSYPRRKPSSPKKVPAPQPRPRTLLLSSTEGHENKFEDAGRMDTSIQKKPVLISQTLPNMMTKTDEGLDIELVRQQDSVCSTSGPIDHNEIQDQELPLKCYIDGVNNVESLVPESVITNESGGRCTISPVESQAATSTEARAWVVESMPEADSSNSDLRMADEEIDRIFTHATRNHNDSPELVVDKDKQISLSTLPSPPTSLPHCEAKPLSQGEEALDWEYKLPAPPTFRDDARSPQLTEFGTVSISNLMEVAGVKTLEPVKSLNKTDLEKIIESEIRTKENNVEDSLKLKSFDSDENITNRESKVSSIPPKISGNKQVQTPKMKKQSPLMELKNEEPICLSSEERNGKLVTNRLINNNHRWSMADLTSLEKKEYNNNIKCSSTLQNFTISTYKDTKPFEVFEDDSIKSSVGEKRDRSKDDAVFRAPKARVKEPNLSRTNSFSVESKANGPMIKRSVSYVSLLAANMPRNSQPYLAHLRQQEPPWSRLRKTTSELNIDDQDGKTNEKSFWEDDSTQFESVKILRNILSQSQLNLTSPRDQVDEVFHKQQRDLPTSVEKLEDTFDVNSSDIKWSRHQSEEASSKSNRWTISGKMQHSGSLDEEETKAAVNIQRGGGPAVNFSTWSERPKRQVSIKNDNDYISGFGKKTIVTQVEDSTESLWRDSLSTTTKMQTLNSPRCIGMISKNSSLKLDERSKSTSDLSRIPIVRAVEFKKPFAVNSYDRSSLKPVQILEDIDNVVIKNQEKTYLDDFNNNDDENFAGVDSLARRFGVPQKRSTLLNVNSQQVKANTQTDIKDSVKLLRSLSSINSGYSKTDLTTSHVKALAKTKSGGLVGDSLIVEKDSNITSKNHTSVESLPNEGEERISAVNIPVIQNTELNRSSTKSVIKSLQGPSLGSLTSSVYVKHMPAQARPVSLQPVVKGFRVDSQAQTSTSSSTKTKDSRSTSVVNSSSLSHKEVFQRTMSAPVDPTPPTIIKETVKMPSAGITKVSSVPLFVAPNVREDSDVPPPPPMMPVLRPVSERRNIKLLPPPEAKPRDQLMLCIRSFSVDNLRKVSK